MVLLNTTSVHIISQHDLLLWS